MSDHSKEEIREILDTHFNEFEPGIKEEIIEEGIVKYIGKNEMLMDVNQPITSIPLLYEGGVKIFREDEDGNELLIYYLESGESCALSLVCSGRDKTSQIKARTLTDSKFIMLPIYKMDLWMTKYRTWYYYVLETYQRRFEELLQTIDSIAFKNMDERLFEYLTNLSETQNSRIINATHQNIADELNSSREVISRLLKKMEQRGLIQLSRNQIEIMP
ncbi:MAG: Crp/Fnr family transcriptional regulator [Cyclobacteriaceae bacterium]|nr:Crp/Fnr family transcriptional regulator [Cyclobacteriaceae bacterium]MCH8516787.1 Crp/Fnr family transcriptional regulator [Cyclobacteriaceae bacterium]